MGENKGMWITILSILVIGISVTVVTSRLVGASPSKDAAAAETILREQQEEILKSDGMYFSAKDKSYIAPKTEAASEAGGNAAKRSTAPGNAAPGNAALGNTIPGNRDTRNADVAQGRSVGQGTPLVVGSEETALSGQAGAGQPASPPGQASGASGQEAENDSLSAAAAQVPQMAAATAAVPGEASAEIEAGPGAAATAAAPEAVREKSSVEISPLAPGNGNQSVIAAAEDIGAYYTKRLAELDVQIQKLRSDTTDSTTYSVQALADSELKLWNEEVNSLYSIIYEALDSEEKEKLENSQQAWLKDRDKKAETAARKYSGGSLEGVEYTASQAESTRQRAYGLLNEHMGILSPQTTN